ncbi:anti-sigma factor [Agathobaculum sp.]|uniref:anti-sigma factor n=1 Tax=Agathobaculum sp. TaxID=2048138 RepID=UPI0011C21FB6
MMNMWDEMKNIKAPDELKARTRAAVREEKSRARQPVRSMRGGMKRLLAAACAFAVVLGGAALHGRQTGSDPVTDIAHTFGLVAYAADTGEMRQPKDSKIVFDTGSGADDPEKGFYSGCLFKVTGENIKTVSATIDRGAVYRTKTVKDTSADRDEWVRTMYQGTNPAIDGADRIMVWGSDEMHMYADLCWKLDNGFTDEYDPDVSYGLWLPSRQEDADDDLQDSRHKSVDGFEGAKLTVTITFNDGSEQTRSMTLHTGKLGVEYKDDTSGPSLTGEVLTDAQAEEQGYLYGVYGELD